MKVFDFDNTLYRGESAADLFFFMIKRNRKLKKHLPVILINLVKYKLCLVDKDKLESAINGLMKAIIRSREELLAVTADFWRENSHKLNPGILRYMAPEDAVITASPRFLIEGIRDRLPDPDTGIDGGVDPSWIPVKKETRYDFYFHRLSPEFYFYARALYQSNFDFLANMGLIPANFTWSNVSGGMGYVGARGSTRFELVPEEEEL